MLHMPDLLTTDEAATYLRLSERKLYELVANGAVPCSKVTGRWLFPKAALDRWVTAGLVTPTALAQPAPPIVGGSHDPLLEWALRESGSGLASLPEGSESGLRRLARGEVMAAAIHLHRIEGDDDGANADAVAARARPARRGGDRLRPPRAGPAGRAGQSAAADATSPRSRERPRAHGAAAERRRRAAAAAGAARPRRPRLRRAERGQAALPDRPRHRAGGARRARRLRHRHPRGGARGRARFRAADLGALRPGAAPARLFHAGPAGAVRLSAHGRRSATRAAELGGYDVSDSGSVRHVN